MTGSIQSPQFGAYALKPFVVTSSRRERPEPYYGFQGVFFDQRNIQVSDAELKENLGMLPDGAVIIAQPDGEFLYMGNDYTVSNATSRFRTNGSFRTGNLRAGNFESDRFCRHMEHAEVLEHHNAQFDHYAMLDKPVLSIARDTFGRFKKQVTEDFFYSAYFKGMATTPTLQVNASGDLLFNGLPEVRQRYDEPSYRSGRPRRSRSRQRRQLPPAFDDE